MTGRRSKRPKAGDLFLIPLRENVEALGQVIRCQPGIVLVVMFDSLYSKGTASLEDVISSGIDLVGIVFDSKLVKGDWLVVGHRPPIVKPRLWFVIGHIRLGDLSLINYEKTVTRRVAPAEASTHSHRNISSPKMLQMAVAASHELEPWNEAFDHFRAYAKELSTALTE